MRTQLSGTSVAANLTGFKSNATGAPGATWALTATDAADSLAHKVTIRNDSITDHSAKTAILTGTDANGKAMTETVNLPGTSATVTSTNYFLTLTSVVPSATIGADTMDIGWSVASCTNTLFPKTGGADLGQFNIGIGCRVVTGSPTYSIQHTYDHTAWFEHATITGKLVNFDGVITSPVAGIRLQFAAAGGVAANVIQFGV